MLFISTQIGLPQSNLSLPERDTVARPLLLQAEAISSGAEPAACAILLYRAAGAWLDLDRSHAIALDRQAFVSAVLIPNISLRKAIEHDILSDLLPLSPATLLGLIPEAETETQLSLYRAVIDYLLAQGDLSGAIQAFDRAATAGIFSELSTTHILESLPPSNTAERVRIFSSAFTAYKAQKLDHSSSWTASRLVARYGLSLPSEPVLFAINILLDRAAEKDKQQPLSSGSISYGNNSFSYKTYTDLELFAVAPALLKIAPDRAAVLLAVHPAAAEYLRRFPQGLPSFDVNDFYPGGNKVALQSPLFLPTGIASFASDKGAHSIPLTSLDMGLEFTIPLRLEIGMGVSGATVSFAQPGTPEAVLSGEGNTCPPNVPHILASADTVPLVRRVPLFCDGPDGSRCSYQNDYPRAALLNNIAELCTYYLNRPAALSVLTAQLQLLPQVAANQRAPFLANVADLYLRLGDREAAASVVQTGFELAASLLVADSNTDSLKSLPRAVWPSAEVYRCMISLGVNANLTQTSASVEAIPDSDLRELERVMLARALLGIPVRRQIVFYSNGSSMTMQSPGYGDF